MFMCTSHDTLLFHGNMVKLAFVIQVCEVGKVCMYSIDETVISDFKAFASSSQLEMIHS